MRLTYDTSIASCRSSSANGAEWGYGYDDHDDLVARIDPDGLGEGWEWDDGRRVVAETDRRRHHVAHRVRDLGKSPVRVVGPDGSVTSPVLDALDLPASITDADGVTRFHEWDSDGQPVAMIDALGGRSGFVYDGVAGSFTSSPRGGGDRARPRPGGRLVAGALAEVTTYRGPPPGGSTGARSPVTSRGRRCSVRTARSWRSPTPSARRCDSGTTRRQRHCRHRSGRRGVRNRFDDVGRHVSAIEPTGGPSQGLRRARSAGGFTDPRGEWHRRVDAGRIRTVCSIAPDEAVTTLTLPPAARSDRTGPDGRTWSTEVDDAAAHRGGSPSGARGALGYTLAGRIAMASQSGRAHGALRVRRVGRLVAIHRHHGNVRMIARDQRGRLVAVNDSAGTAGVEWDVGFRLRQHRRPARRRTRDSGGRRSAPSPTGGTDRVRVGRRVCWRRRPIPPGWRPASSTTSWRVAPDRARRADIDVELGQRVGWPAPRPIRRGPLVLRDLRVAITAVRPRRRRPGTASSTPSVASSPDGTDGVEHASTDTTSPGGWRRRRPHRGGLEHHVPRDDDDHIRRGGAGRYDDDHSRRRRVGDRHASRKAASARCSTAAPAAASSPFVTVLCRAGRRCPAATASSDRAGALRSAPTGRCTATTQPVASPRSCRRHRPTQFVYGDDGLVVGETVPGTRRFAYDEVGRIARSRSTASGRRRSNTTKPAVAGGGPIRRHRRHVPAGDGRPAECRDRRRRWRHHRDRRRLDRSDAVVATDVLRLRRGRPAARPDRRPMVQRVGDLT